MRRLITFVGIIMALSLLGGTMSCLPPYENHFKRAIEAVSNDDYGEAITEFTIAIEIAPDRVAGYFWRGVCYHEIGQYDLAIDDFTTVINLRDESMDTDYNSRGLAYSAKGDYDLAISDFTQAIEIYQQHPLYYNNRGLAYNSQGNYDLAIQDFTIAINIDPRDGRPYSNRADSYIATGQTPLAIIDLRKTIEFAYDDPDLMQSARERLKSLGVIE